MSVRELRASLATAVVVLAVGCASPSAPASGGAAVTLPATTPATSTAPSTASSPSASPTGAASSPGNLVVIVDGVEYTCSQMFSPTGEDCPARVQELWGR